MNKLAIGKDPLFSKVVKIYKQKGSSYILCQDQEDNEYIYNLREDGTVSEGINRERWNNGNTVIGSQYCRRSGRKGARIYRLIRDYESGDIEYQDRIRGKDDHFWRVQTVYSFNSETLDWTKTTVL